MNILVRDALELAVQGSANDYGTAQKSSRRIRRDATILMKSIEPVLENLCNHGLEDMTIQELYEEISGQAHLG